MIILANIFLILIVLYFIPFLGICLFIFRKFYYKNHQRKFDNYLFLIIGLFIFIINKVNISIPYLSSIIKTTNFLNYSKRLIILGVIFIIIDYLAKNILGNMTNFVKNYINESEQQDLKIKAKNDLIMQEKREKAKNTTYIKCPYCGADNLISEKIGICNYCRRKITNQKEN